MRGEVKNGKRKYTDASETKPTVVAPAASGQLLNYRSINISYKEAAVVLRQTELKCAEACTDSSNL